MENGISNHGDRVRQRACFFDIDGTLWDRQNRIPQSAVRAIRALRRNGHKALLCSGRSRSYIFDEALLAIGFDGIVSGAGAMLELNGETLFSHVFSPEQVLTAVQTAEEFGYTPLLEGVRTISIRAEGFPIPDYYDKLKRELGDVLEPLSRRWGRWDDTSKLTVLGLPGARPMDELRQALSGAFDFLVHGPALAELVLPGVNKGTGLRAACEAMRLDVRDSVAFGDSANDAQMLEASGVGVCMGNGTDALKRLADLVTAPMEQDGVLVALERLGLI